MRPGGNKNAAFPLLAAALLTAAPVTLRNLPDIDDVRTMLRMMEGMGITVNRADRHTVTVRAGSLQSTRPDPELLKKIRGALVLMGALLAREGHAERAARLAQVDAAQHDLADPELLADERVQADAARHEIPARDGEVERLTVLLLEALDFLGFDQRDVLPRLVVAPEVTVAVDAAAGNDDDAPLLDCRSAGYRADEDAFDHRVSSGATLTGAR